MLIFRQIIGFFNEIVAGQANLDNNRNNKIRATGLIKLWIKILKVQHTFWRISLPSLRD